MKRLAIIVLAATFATCGWARSNGETHSGDSVLHVEAGENTRVEKKKQAYLKQIQGQLQNFESQLTSLRAQRERLAPGTSAYKSLDLRVESMSSKMAAVRRDIARLEADESAHWELERDAINENLADLNRLATGLAE